MHAQDDISKTAKTLSQVSRLKSFEVVRAITAQTQFSYKIDIFDREHSSRGLRNRNDNVPDIEF